MKSIPCVILALSSVQAIGADWWRYHFDPQQGIEIFLDRDSLQQTAEAVSMDVRLSASHSQQAFLARQTVSCLTPTYTLSQMRELGQGKNNDRVAEDETGTIPLDSALEGLKELYCARWQEPTGVRWKAYATAPGETFFYDERIEHMLEQSGFPDEFTVHYKSLGKPQSRLAEIRISCRAHTFAILTATHRNEANGLLTHLDQGSPAVAPPGSPADILMSLLCAPAVGSDGQPTASPP